MRIAISGTHGIGKTTLTEDFIESHPKYTLEVEPYHQLEDLHGTAFSKDLSFECILEQLNFSLERLDDLADQDNVIFDRCPLDFVAYAMALDTHEEELIQDHFSLIHEALDTLDLIIFLPIVQEYESHFHDDEDPDFRKRVDKILKRIYRQDPWDLLPSLDHPQIVDVWGSRKERLSKLMSFC